MMKRILLVMVMVVLVATTVSAQLPPQGYYGLFFDTNRTTWCYTGAGMVTFYLFCLPPESGLDCVELKLTPPSGYFIFNEVYHVDVMQPVMGNLPSGLAACFGNCWYEWIQVASATIAIADLNPNEVIIEPFPGSPYPKILDCLVPANETEAIPWTHLYTNYAECPGYAVRESTWGAIKNMYE